MAENAQSAATPVSDQAKDAQPSDFETMSAAAAQANEDAYRAEEEKKAALKKEKEARIKAAGQQASDKIDQELANLESERKRRKKEVDGKAVEEKLAIDKDIAEQKGALEAARASRVKAAEELAQVTEVEAAAPSDKAEL